MENRQLRPRSTAPRSTTLTASAAVDAAQQRRAAARERYRALKEAGGKEYERMLAADRERAARFHERHRKAAKKAQARSKKAGSL